MALNPLTKLTPAEYLAYERAQTDARHEYLDGEITLIGSANMDRRSFDLNYENNILLYDCALTAEVRRRLGL